MPYKSWNFQRCNVSAMAPTTWQLAYMPGRRYVRAGRHLLQPFKMQRRRWRGGVEAAIMRSLSVFFSRAVLVSLTGPRGSCFEPTNNLYGIFSHGYGGRLGSSGGQHMDFSPDKLALVTRRGQQGDQLYWKGCVRVRRGPMLCPNRRRPLQLCNTNPSVVCRRFQIRWRHKRSSLSHTRSRRR